MKLTFSYSFSIAMSKKTTGMIFHQIWGAHLAQSAKIQAMAMDMKFALGGPGEMGDIGRLFSEHVPRTANQ